MKSRPLVLRGQEVGGEMNAKGPEETFLDDENILYVIAVTTIVETHQIAYLKMFMVCKLYVTN